MFIKKPGHYEMMMLFYSHSFSFSFPLYISLKIKDQRIMEAFYDYEVPLQWLQTLTTDDKKYQKGVQILDKCMNFIDFRNRNSKEFFDSLIVSHNALYKTFYNGFCGKEKFVINCVPHSHIDVAWLWDLDQTKQKVQRTFSTVLSLMDEYPNFRYMHTTPQVFDFLKKDNPRLYSKIKQKVNEGQFELEGAMWVEADNNLVSGESLVRQIYYGQKFLNKEFNVNCSAVLEPDVFGYSAQLPQIMSKFGLKRFVTAKIGWNDTNRFPYDTFNWIGLDGSKILTYLISTCDANPRVGIKDTTYTNYVGEMTARQLLGTINRYQNKNINNVLLSTIGYGDGGGGPTREMIEREKRCTQMG
ncbi:MAG: hypothetical protein MJ227_04175 [Bacilli bacterium]|nr:hypothetical protein [Bacilli bacterium]